MQNDAEDSDDSPGWGDSLNLSRALAELRGRLTEILFE